MVKSFESISEAPRAKFGTFKWMDIHLKQMTVALMVVCIAYSFLMIAYVNHLLGYSESDLSNRYLAITTAIFAAVTLLNNILSIIGILIDSASLLSMGKLNNSFVTLLSMILSGVNFAKGVYFLRDEFDTTGLSSVFIATGAGFLCMAITYGMLIYLMLRYGRNKVSPTADIETGKRLEGKAIMDEEDLNSTRTYASLDPQAKV